MAAGSSTESVWTELVSQSEWYKLAMAIIVFCMTSYLQVIRSRQYKIISELWLSGFLLFSFLTASSALVFYVSGGNGAISVHSFRLLLVSLLAQALASYLNRNSEDPSVHFCLTISNIMMRSVLLLCFMYSISAVNSMSNFACALAMAVLIPLLIGDALDLVRLSAQHRPRSFTVGDPVSWHLSVDAFGSFLLGAVLLAFPDLFLGVLDANCPIKEVCLLCTRTYGSLVISGAVLSFASLTFKNNQDALNTLVAKTVVYIPTLLMTMANGFSGGNFILIFAVGALAYNTCYAVCRPE